MKIVVCIKQVPAKDAPLVIADETWIRETDIGFEMNEPDSFALEEALRLKEKHTGEVIAVSMGPERVKQTIKEALAKGADRGVHIADDKAHTLDPLGAAKSLAAAIEREKPDLVLTGLQSDDHGFGQTGVLLAGMLDVPQATIWILVSFCTSLVSRWQPSRKTSPSSMLARPRMVSVSARACSWISLCMKCLWPPFSAIIGVQSMRRVGRLAGRPVRS